MKKYIVRVELQHATYDDYTQLDALLTDNAFTSLLSNAEGDTFYLPLKEYFLQSARPVDEVLQQVLQLAHAVNDSPSVVVTEARHIAWHLRPVATPVMC